MSLAQLHSEKLPARVLPKSLPPSLIISVLLLSTLWASAADPLGATPHSDGSTPRFAFGLRSWTLWPSRSMAELRCRWPGRMATRIPRILLGSAQSPGPR